MKSRIFYSKKKIIYERGIYHVTQRAPGSERLFLEEKDYFYMIYLIKEIAKKFRLDIFAFVLMWNHLHLLLQIREANLSKAMHNIFTRYGIYFNEKYKRKGHVFCGSYRAALCLNDAYLLTTSIYIHLNPFKANLVKNLFQYKWSSIKSYTWPSSGKTFLNNRVILNLLDEDLLEARRKYKKILLESMDIKFSNWGEDYNVFKRFMKVVLNKLSNMSKIELASKEILEEIELNKKIMELAKKGRLRKPEDKTARRYLIEQLLSRGYSIKEIAREFNMDRRSIYNVLNFPKKAKPVLGS